MKIVDGVIHVGPVDYFVVHHGEDMNNPTCRYGQEPNVRTKLSTSSLDWAMVTCQSCIEWRHA